VDKIPECFTGSFASGQAIEIERIAAMRGAVGIVIFEIATFVVDGERSVFILGKEG
jgi:hypothetical protein